MKTKLVRIGNSRGVRLPKPLLDQAGLTDEVELEVRGGAIVITAKGASAPARHPRVGWAEAAAKLREREGGGLLDASTPTRFDEDEWRW